MMRRYNRPPTIATAVYDTLLEQLVHGKLAPGERLREVVVAKEFGVSPTPVREAFARLEQDGLVEIQPHQGAIVRAFTPRDVAELYSLREVLEVHALQQALQSDLFDPHCAAVERLQANVVESRPYALVVDREGYNRLDIEFHDLLIELSGNSRLNTVYRNLFNQIQRVRLQTVFLPGRPLKSQEEHEAFVSAFVAGDISRAEAVLREHIRGALTDMLAAFDHQTLPQSGLGRDRATPEATPKSASQDGPAAGR